MSSRISRIVIAALSSICFLPSARAQSASLTRDYSKEAAVIQQFSKRIAFSDDGTFQLQQEAVVRVQSDAGVQQLGVLSFSYNRDNQKIEVDYVRVRKPDNTLIATPETDIQDVSSEITRVAPTYSDLREKQIPVKALGVGDLLEYKIRWIQVHPEIPGHFWYVANFVTDTVTLRESLEISVPSGKYVKVASPKLTPTTHQEHGRTVYVWTSSHLEPSSEASEKAKHKPSSDGGSPSVQLTTFKTWDEVGRWYRDLQAQRVVVSPAILAKAQELTKNPSSDADKAVAIYNFVSTRFRYISLSFGTGRYQPHSADDVLGNQYGDCKDKHTLFAALLKAAGIEAWPALIGMDIKFDESVPSPAQFNHVITVVPQKAGYVWLDTTPEVAPYGLLLSALRDHKALVIPNSGQARIMNTPADPPFPSSHTANVQATLKPNGTLNGHFDLTTRGDEELLLRIAFHQVPASNWRELVQNLIRSQGFMGTVSNVSVDNPNDIGRAFHYSFDYERPNYSDWENRRISAPLFPILLAPGEDWDKPTEPFFLGAPGKLELEATIRLPENYTAEIPSDTKLQTAFADYAGSYSLASGVLKADRSLTIKKSKAPVEAWDDYVKFAKAVASDHDRFIQLAVSGENDKSKVAGENSEAADLVAKALQAGQTQHYDEVRDYLARAERLNPKQRNLWAAYGSL